MEHYITIELPHLINETMMSQGSLPHVIDGNYAFFEIMIGLVLISLEILVSMYL